MTTKTPLPESLARLAQANPARADDEMGRSEAAEAALARILQADVGRARRPILRAGRRVVLVTVAALLLLVAAALAASDPFGLFHSVFRIDRSRHVHPPTAVRIKCPKTSGAAFSCGASLTGRPYMLLTHVEAPTAELTRTDMSASVQRALRSGRISAARARQIQADLAKVSDAFLARLRQLMQYVTFGASLGTDEGKQRVPPAGVPALIACEPGERELTCRDLNGAAAAIGGGIYEALPSADWRPAPRRRREPAWARVLAILGHPTAAELRLIDDLASVAEVSSGSTSSSGARSRGAASSRR